MLAAGERIGLMRFGSRMDVFMPAGSRIQVRAGDRVRGGLTVVEECCHEENNGVAGRASPGNNTARGCTSSEPVHCFQYFLRILFDHVRHSRRL